ncbi:ABC transporter substrate-binding protein [Salinispirillum marinum]|uniref:ABC transporter substrate-binding protein n=2 Tax=Saccharospirillaceae TaxID=255527 RepID=A0ABV8BHC9_9GAMM
MNKKVLMSATLAGLMAAGSHAVAQEIKVGFLGGFTGPIESLAPGILQGAQLAVSQVNAQGGLLNGRTLSMPTADTTCVDASAASNSADRLVNSEGVVAIVGGLCSGATIAAANNAGIPGNVVMISPASTAPAVSDINDNDLVFRTVPSDSFQGIALARLLLSKGIREVAVTFLNNDYGRGLADAFVAEYQMSGGQVLANVAHEEGRADYRSELGNIASSGAETLVVLAYADGSGQTIVRQAYESGNFLQLVGADGMVGDALVNAVGAQALEGMIATRAGSPEIEGADVFAAAANAVNLDPNAVYAAQAYDAAFLLALAIEKNGSADRDSLSDALRSVATAPGEVILPGEWEKAKRLIAAGQDINYEGAAGSQEFDAKGDVPGVVVEMVVRNGRFETLGLID